MTKQKQQYKEKNKDKVKKMKKQYASQKCICECGAKYIMGNKTRHLKTQKHINYMNQQATKPKEQIKIFKMVRKNKTGYFRVNDIKFEFTEETQLNAFTQAQTYRNQLH